MLKIDILVLIAVICWRIQSCLCISDQRILFNVIIRDARYTETERLFTSLEEDSHYLKDFQHFKKQTDTNDDLLKKENILRSKRKGFCRLLCAICEDRASRRWSALCGSQCENGGIAYHVCLTAWKDFGNKFL